MTRCAANRWKCKIGVDVVAVSPSDNEVQPFVSTFLDMVVRIIIGGELTTGC